MFTDKEDVSGVVKIKPNGKPVAHEGIKIECIGQIGVHRFPQGLPHSSDERAAGGPSCDPRLLNHAVVPLHVELFYDRGNSYEFTSLVRELEGPGSVNDVKEFPFAFEGVEKKFESYSGINVRLR